MAPTRSSRALILTTLAPVSSIISRASRFNYQLARVTFRVGVDKFIIILGRRARINISFPSPPPPPADDNTLIVNLFRFGGYRVSSVLSVKTLCKYRCRKYFSRAITIPFVANCLRMPRNPRYYTSIINIFPTRISNRLFVRTGPIFLTT